MKFIALVCAAALSVVSAHAQSLLVNPNLSGSVETGVWSNLTAVNTHQISPAPNRILECYADNIFDLSVDFRVYAPGYGANAGLYSWTGAYRTTTAKTTNNFAIKQAVFQLDLVWDPATGFPYNNGPRLSYNGGTQNLAPMPMILGGSRQVNNDTGIEDMKDIDHFVYRGVLWQWDLSQIEGDIHNITISMPYANHTSVVASRLDVASEFHQVGGTTATPLQLWRDNYFHSTANTGNAADNADPDGDGIPNLMEYALGTRPDSGEDEHGAAGLPKAAISGDRARLSFMIPSAPPSEIQYRVQVSADLVTWKTIATKAGAAAWVWTGTGTSQITSQTSVERQPFVIGDEVTSTSNARRFMRLQVAY